MSVYGDSCWCGEPQRHEDPLIDLGHGILTELRIPQIVEWLAQRLNRR